MTLASVAAALRTGRPPAELRDLLHRALATEGESLNLSFHPVGFINLPLGTSAERVNIHVWHPRIRRPQIPPHTCHTHGWELESHVICGHVIDYRFRVRPDADGTYAVYQVSYEKGGSVSRRTNDRVAVESLTRQVFRTGDTYSIPPEDFHRSELPDVLSVTAIHDVGGVVTAGRTVRPVDHPLELTYVRELLDDELAREVLRDIRQSLETH